MNKINIFLLLLTVLFFSGCMQPRTPIAGFRDMQFGDGIEKLGNYTVIDENKMAKTVSVIKKDEYLRISDVDFTKIEYRFFDNQFYGIIAL